MIALPFVLLHALMLAGVGVGASVGAHMGVGAQNDAFMSLVWYEHGQSPAPQVGRPSLHHGYRSTPPPYDAWFGEDKLEHMFASLALVGFAQAGARAAGVKGTSAVLVGVTAGGAAGLWKEIRDRTRGGSISVRDLAWDAVGVGLGALLVSHARE